VTCGLGPHSFRASCETAPGLRAGGPIAVPGGLRAERKATVPTTTKLTPAEIYDRLGELLKFAVDHAAAESGMERLAADLREHEDDWTEDLPYFQGAVAAEIRQALYNATSDDSIDALERCQSIQNAIDVLKFAIERDDRAS
jgi:hypothetical protein